MVPQVCRQLLGSSQLSFPFLSKATKGSWGRVEAQTLKMAAVYLLPSSTTHGVNHHIFLLPLCGNRSSNNHLVSNLLVNHDLART